MPIQTDFPTGVGNPENWWFEGAPSKIVAVHTNDGDLSFGYGTSGGAVKTMLYTFPPLVGVTSPVNSASLNALVRIQKLGGSSQSGQTFQFYWNGAPGPNVFSNLLAGFSNYVLLTHTVAAPTLAAVNGQHGLSLTGVNNNNQFEVWCTQFWRSVDFEYPAAGGGGEFAHLLG